MPIEEGPKNAPYMTHHYGNPNDPEDHKDEQEIIGSCNIDTLNHLRKEHPKGFFLVVTQDGCGDCETMRSVLDETVKDLVPIIEAATEDKECASLAEQLKVGLTPTVIYYEGEKEQRFSPDGKMTWDQLRQQLREIVNKPVAPVPTPSAPQDTSR